MTFGLAIGGSIFVNTAQNGLYQVLPDVPKETVDQLVAGTTSEFIGTLSPELKVASLKVIVSSWQNVFIVIYVGAAVSLLCSLFLNVCLITDPLPPG
jgi:hypothetical protein